MNRLFISILLAIVAISYPPLTMGQLNASEAFINAPKSVFPLLDQLTKLDMVDYYNNAMSTPSTNALAGKSRITLLNPRKLTVEMTNSSTYELDLLTTNQGDTFIALISTVATPAHDSQLAVYSHDWNNNITEQVFEKPVLDDWLTSEGKNNKGDVEVLVPFLLIGYTYNPETSTLLLTNNTKEFLSSDIYDIVAPYFHSTLEYKWNGKKFTLSR